MNESRSKRSKLPEAPESPSGYRSTRRGAKAARVAKKAERNHKVATAVTRTGRGVKNILWLIVMTLVWIVGTAIVLLLLANIVNHVARWNAQRSADQRSGAPLEERARDNLLVVGVDSSGKAKGFLAMRYERKSKQVFGVAIPDGAFIEVPGKGFDRVGESFKDGPEVSATAISNFMSVPFASYLVVPEAAYTKALTEQSVGGLPAAATASNLTPEELQSLGDALIKVAKKDVALVPMPVKPMKLGDQTYFEPQRGEVADLIKQWWGVDVGDNALVTRVIVYNGAGVPGIAGIAAQQLIRAGYRVVDTKNADRFTYVKSEIIVKRGDAARGAAVAKVLGSGTVKLEPSEADVTDVIVIIGKDYKAPADAPKKGK